MGQSLDSMSPSRVVEGEVEVCHEAISLLLSLEEHRTEVLNVSPPRKLQKPRSRKGNAEEEEQSSRVRRALCIGDFYEDDMEKATSFDQMDEQLADVLYALHFLSIPKSFHFEGNAEGHGGGTSEIDGQGNQTSDSGTPFSKQDLQKTLKEIFDVDDATLDMIYLNVRKRQKPLVTLHLHIIEAKDLRPKTKGTTNAYCVVRLSGTNEVHQTEVLHNQLAPFWDSPFLIKISEMQGATVTIEVWHEPKESSMEKIPAVRDLKEIGRAILGTNEIKNLLGSVTIPLENIKNKLVDEWYTLAKKEEGKTLSLRESFRANKKRGSLHLSLKTTVKSELNLLGSHWYDTLLNKVLQHRMGFLCSLGTFFRDSGRCSVRSNVSVLSRTRSTSSSSSAKSNPSTGSASTSSSGFINCCENETVAVSNPTAPWAGEINDVESFILSQYGSVLNMTPPLVTLSWWKITSKLPLVDQSYLGDLLVKLGEGMQHKDYSEEEIKDAQSSLRIWVCEQEEKLKNLHTSFPTNSRMISQHQLTHTLRNLKVIESVADNYGLQVFLDGDVVEIVTNALTEFTKIWWERALQNCDRNCPRANEEQLLEAVVFVTGEVFYFFTEVCNFYEAIFKNEAGISYLRLSYLLLTSELAARIRPLLHKMYDGPVLAKGANTCSKTKSENCDDQGMDERRPVWQLYKKLGNIAIDIGGKLPEEVQGKCGITSYHSWFLKVIMRWQEQMLSRSKALVQEEVEKDTFVIQNTDTVTSASASEVSFIFRIVKETWSKLCWPFEVDGDVIGNKLLESLCCIGKYYAKLVHAKLLSKKLKPDTQEEIPQDHFLPAQICVALNDIEFLREEIRGLPVLLNLCEKEDNVNRFSVITNTLQIMERKLLVFIDTCVRKVKPILRTAILTSCDTASEDSLLSDCLDGEFCHLKKHLTELNLKRVLLKVWNCLISLFREIVKEKVEVRMPEYFNGIHKILDKTWYFLTPVDRSGLDPQIAYTPDYQSLVNDLSNLRMGTESLIAKYYQKRYEEQQKEKETVERHSSSELVVLVYFTKTEKLHVEVAMARNLRNSAESVHGPLPLRKSTLKLLDTYVQVKVVPSDWFPCMNWKTKIRKKEHSPVFEESHDFNISSKEHSAQVGFLLFSVKTSQHFHDGFIGEAILPLDTVACVELCSASKVAHKHLSLTLPKEEDNYLAVKALKLRTKDKKALNFLKELRDLNRKKGNGT